jgi:nitrogen-specific signal transduction histidine kinase
MKRHKKESENFDEFETTEKFYSCQSKKIEFFDEDSLMSKQFEFYCLHIFTDKTSEKKLKSEKMNREYQRLMMSSVAHEFRNPLNSIKGNLDLIEFVSKDEKVKKFSASAYNS